MTRFSVAWALLGCCYCLQLADAARCSGDSPPGPPNLHPIDTSAPKLNKTVANGKLYTVGSGEDAVDLLHLYGTPYEQGFAHGTLLKEKLLAFYPQVETYLAEQISKKAAHNPVFKWILEASGSNPIETPRRRPLKITCFVRWASTLRWTLVMRGQRPRCSRM